ncbi:GrpB family protein [Asanoa sp. NPDC049518]|uniref:GrpB family protein n=1 Tax=unclassified Asanoa TaxID=2685164 RepID=UPI003438E53A
MRLPPLPAPAPPVTEEWLRARNVGDPPRLTEPISVVAYDPEWPALYARHAARIRAALGPTALAVEHVGSTAVPGLAAKFRIDVDVVVADPRLEDAYLPALTAAGYVLRIREPEWYEHRCLHGFDPPCNVHVFPPDCDEHLRHLILRDWLRTHPEDRARYAAEKRRIATSGVTYMAEYANQKSTIIIELLRRAGLT